MEEDDETKMRYQKLRGGKRGSELSPNGLNFGSGRWRWRTGDGGGSLLSPFFSPLLLADKP